MASGSLLRGCSKAALRMHANYYKFFCTFLRTSRLILRVMHRDQPGVHLVAARLGKCQPLAELKDRAASWRGSQVYQCHGRGC